MKTLLAWLSILLFGFIAGIAWFTGFMLAIADKEAAVYPALGGAFVIWLAMPLAAWRLWDANRSRARLPFEFSDVAFITEGGEPRGPVPTLVTRCP